MSETAVVKIKGEGDFRVSMRVRRECFNCGDPATMRHTFLLPNARTNPASFGYRKDDVSWWCSDRDVHSCEECKRDAERFGESEGLKWCSTFTLGDRFAHMFLEWVDVEGTPAEVAAKLGLAVRSE